MLCSSSCCQIWLEGLDLRQKTVWHAQKIWRKLGTWSQWLCPDLTRSSMQIMNKTQEENKAKKNISNFSNNLTALINVFFFFSVSHTRTYDCTKNCQCFPMFPHSFSTELKARSLHSFSAQSWLYSSYLQNNEIMYKNTYKLTWTILPLSTSLITNRKQRLKITDSANKITHKKQKPKTTDSANKITHVITHTKNRHSISLTLQTK